MIARLRDRLALAVGLIGCGGIVAGLALPWASAGAEMTPAGRCAATVGCEPGGGKWIRSLPTRSGFDFVGDAAVVLVGLAVAVAVALALAPERRLTSSVTTGLGAVTIVVAAVTAYILTTVPAAPSYLEPAQTPGLMVGPLVTAAGGLTVLLAGLFLRNWRQTAYVGLATIGLVTIGYPLITVQFVGGPSAYSPDVGYFHSTLGIDVWLAAMIAVGVDLFLVGMLFRTIWLDRRVPSPTEL